MENSRIAEVNKKKGKGIGRAVAMLGLAAVAVLAFAAYKYLTNRPGEAAIKYIPADASLVATFDGNPSTSQLASFARIKQALGSEQIGDLSATLLGNAFNNNPVVKDVQPYVTNNLAFAAWTDAKFEKTETALFMSITDSSAVERALAKDCKEGPGGGLYAMPAMPNGLLGVVGNYLIFTNSAARFDQIVQVSKGKLPSVATLNAYTAARAALPSDSNLMCFVSPEVYRQSQAVNKRPVMKSSGWFSLGIAVREKGLAMVCRTPINDEGLGTAPKLDLSILNKLPSGAYGVLAISDPSAWYTAYAKSTGSEATVESALADVRQKNGIDPISDVLAKLSGDVELAVYPGKTSTTSSPTASGFSSTNSMQPGILLYADSANGEDPIVVANKVFDAMQAHSSAWGNATVTKSQVGEATVWTVKQGATAQPTMQGQPQPAPQDPWSVIATRGTIYITSSPAMQAQVLAMGTSGPTLAQDAPFVAMEKSIVPSAQSALMVSLHRIFKSAMSGQDSVYTEVFGGGHAGVVGSSHYDNKTGVFELFIPLDWEKAIHWMGDTMKKAKAPPAPNPGSIS
ncbi:MAG TPA: hypothetical protein VGL56_01030 [Fimbriimonadaceae bacterium]